MKETENNLATFESNVTMTMLAKAKHVLPLLADALGIPQKPYANAGVSAEALRFKDGQPFRSLTLDLPATAEGQEERVMHVAVYIGGENSINFPTAFIRAKKATVKLPRDEAKRCKWADEAQAKKGA